MAKFLRNYLYLSVFLTGAAVLLIEILGTRIIGPFYGTTVFVWTSLITVTLSALALGYLVGGKVADQKPEAKVLFGIIAVAGLTYFLPIKIDQWVLPLTDPLGLRYGPLAAAAALFFLPLMFLGMVTPFAVRLVTENVDESGRVAGRIFALATVGSIVGGLTAGFYLLAALSLTQSFSYMALILVGIGAVGIFLSTSSKKKLDAIIVLLGISFVVWQIPAYEYDDNYTLQIHHHEQSFYGDLKVTEIGWFKCLTVDGSIQSCINLREQKPTFTFIAETERMIAERKPKNMLLLGMGSGNVLHNLPDDLEVDVVEIDPALVPISKEYFGLNENQYSRLIIDDARHFLETNKKKYDFILVDTFLGNTLPLHMFTVEAMESWYEALNNEGLLMVNMEGKLGKEDIQIQTIMKTAETVFPTLLLTATEIERFTSVLLHMSKNPNYTFIEGGRFTEQSMILDEAKVMTDDHNRLEIISIEKLQIFRDEMVNSGGFKQLFSTS